MARKFNGTSDAATIPLDLSHTKVCTLSFWLWWDGFGTDDHMAAEFNNSFNFPTVITNSFSLIPNGSTGPGWEVWQYDSTDNSKWGDSFPRPSPAAWHHYLLVMDRVIPANLAWVDGVPQTMTTLLHGTFTGAGRFDNSTLYLMSRTASTLFGRGRMADLAVWGDVLSTPEAGLLSRGVSPLAVRRDKLIAYLPLDGVRPERVLASRGIYAAPLTVTGTTAINSPLGPLAEPFNMPQRLLARINSIAAAGGRYRTLLGVGQ